MKLRSDVRAILVGGSSHAGKTTLSECLASELGWDRVSTDSLARHPGRPWRPEPEQVSEKLANHYLCLSVDELIADVLRHYKDNVWPKVEAIVASYLAGASGHGVVVEGSALWPDFATSLDCDRTGALWLTASEEVFTQRIYCSSRYYSKSPRERLMVDKFLLRTLAYNSRMAEAARRHDFMLVDVGESNLAGDAQLSAADTSGAGSASSRRRWRPAS